MTGRTRKRTRNISDGLDRSVEYSTIPQMMRYQSRDIRPMSIGGAHVKLVHGLKTALDPNASSVYQGVLYYPFVSIPGSADITYMYDLYRIDKIVYDIHLAHVPNRFDDGQPSTCPKLWWCSDNDNANELSISEIKTRDSARSALVTYDRMFSIVHYPEVPLNSANVSGGYVVRSNRANEYFSTTNTATQWGYLKWALECPTKVAGGQTLIAGMANQIVVCQPHFYLRLKAGK